MIHAPKTGEANARLHFIQFPTLVLLLCLTVPTLVLLLCLTVPTLVLLLCLTVAITNSCAALIFRTSIVRSVDKNWFQTNIGKNYVSATIVDEMKERWRINQSSHMSRNTPLLLATLSVAIAEKSESFHHLQYLHQRLCNELLFLGLHSETVTVKPLTDCDPPWRL